MANATQLLHPVQLAACLLVPVSEMRGISLSIFTSRIVPAPPRHTKHGCDQPMTLLAQKPIPAVPPRNLPTLLLQHDLHRAASAGKSEEPSRLCSTIPPFPTNLPRAPSQEDLRDDEHGRSGKSSQRATRHDTCVIVVFTGESTTF